MYRRGVSTEPDFSLSFNSVCLSQNAKEGEAFWENWSTWSGCPLKVGMLHIEGHEDSNWSVCSEVMKSFWPHDWKPVSSLWQMESRSDFISQPNSFRLQSLSFFFFFFKFAQDARQKFRSVLVEATVKLDELLKKIGKPVEESKPYWEARRLARQVGQQLLFRL